MKEQSSVPMKRFIVFMSLMISIGICSAETAIAIQDKSNNEGVRALIESRYEDAERFFSENNKTPETQNASFMHLSRIALEQGDDESAVMYIQKALSIVPNNAEEFIFAGDAYCSKAQRSSLFSALKLAKKCIAEYDNAVQLEPNNIDALVAAMKFHYGAPSIAGGSSKKANEYLQRLQYLSPEHANAYRVQIFEQDGDTKAALQLADELSAKGFSSAINQYEIGHFYRDKKQLNKAMLNFESASLAPLTLNNKWHVTDALLQLGEIAMLEGDNKKAIELIERYQAKNKNTRDIHYFWANWSLAKAYRAAGNENQYQLLVEKIKSENYQSDKEFVKDFEAKIKLP